MDFMILVDTIKQFSGTIHGESELKSKLDIGKPLRIKYGIDPTAPDVHLGHTVPLRLLRSLQDLGHKAVIVIGNATARVGDPSGRDETRVTKTSEQIRENSQKYLDQIGKVINIADAEIQMNGNWFGSINFDGLLHLVSKFTVQQILTREDFSKRMNSNVPIFMHELLYPVMQGYDSVMINADIEIGGTEQLFNMNMGRDMQKMWSKRPQIVITLPILRGTDGTRRMGKSLGNYIGINESPFEMYSKVMSIPDDLMREWFSLLTNISSDTVDSFFTLHTPKIIKTHLADHIVRQYHDDTCASKAAKDWTTQFTDKGVPSEVEEIHIHKAVMLDDKGMCKYSTALKEMGFAASNNEARRFIEQNAVSVLSNEVCKDKQASFVKIAVGLVNACFIPHDGMVFKVGRRIRKLRIV